MVMDATHSAAHSARSVGREFVRQYYTLLNQAPAHLHRFYNHNSAFIHGGLDNTDRDVIPAVGQKEIHQKIQELNFRDCHTRISQVDSQATLEDGVVIQVTGEFSNAGEPMRRFTQTFVLAARAPKTYYVLNDIFRYQDLGFPDEEVELETEPSNDIPERPETEEGRSEVDEDDQGQGQAPVQVEHHIAQQAAQQPLPPQAQPVIPPQQMYYPPTSNQMIVVNGTIHDPEAMMNQQPPMMPIPQQPAAPFVEPAAEFTQEEAPVEQQPESQSEETRVEEPQEPPTENFNQQPVNEAENEQTASSGVNNKPKSYARTVRSNAIGGSCNIIPKTMSPPPVSNVRNEERPSIDVWNQNNTNMSSNVMSSGPVLQHQYNRMQNSQQQPQPQRPRVGPPQKDNRGGERRRDWPDHHQLFVGNVPHSATENELRIIFERFGKVADLRIFSKGNERSKGPQGSNNSMRGVPHYGFVTFEDSNVVSKVLAACKKNKPRIPGDNMRNQDNMRSSMGPQQRGPGGPGVMRGGQHPRGGRGGFSRDGRGGMRQPGMGNTGGYQNRR
ncbi:Similar to G3BP2: Ras GTPase-activating protein-binding protein 2 (Pongo abelii) [Cotesia congregata]|uniref:Similar to G3BP2: Ras GTPase-activating protein-binding protein 2 (Pongo abelii) n=1 Tax=Cotesia congregata TaxID=51543 RepID=A0A8J2EBJ0_COTCN|nr:Similar to G3BP2: Ras GTPase-activating protein-binding protein 2 (Pongo abelii) [Cotesia congregata]